MKKLIVALALAALTVPVFAAQQAEGKAQTEETKGKKKSAKKKAAKKEKKTEAPAEKK